MDREGDTVEVFAERQSLGGEIDLLVRARHDRSLDKKKRSLLEQMRSAPARGRLGSKPFLMTAVHAVEDTDPADGSERLEWLLLTTLPVAGEEQAREALELYALHHRIEDWHRVLKSGCRVEKIAHDDAERTQRAAAINALIAWRLAVLTMCGRETPELDAKCFFTNIEIAIPADFATERRLPWPDNLDRAMGLVAAMGGHLHGKHDPPPGNEIVWLGYARLADSSASIERAMRLGPESEAYKQLWSD
ncbi:MAG: IS4 family transposase [Albidovulum sp.]|nr:IS4 family transposase [Albidovulum sp.]